MAGMAKLSTHDIRNLARQIVLDHPGGIRFSDICRQIKSAYPETPAGTVNTQTLAIIDCFPNEIVRPSRGLYMPVGAPPQPKPENCGVQKSLQDPGEVSFYEPFGEWLKNDLGEVTVVAPLGGGGLKAKWGTPDVVGVYKPLASDRIKFPIEIVCGEVKTDPTQPVVAFGQAVAYRLFSSKSYMAVPSTMSEVDLSRLEALSLLFGIGLVIFDPIVSSPDFRIRVRAQRFSPDMFYVNEFADRLHLHAPELFEKLFS